MSNQEDKQDSKSDDRNSRHQRHHQRRNSSEQEQERTARQDAGLREMQRMHAANEKLRSEQEQLKREREDLKKLCERGVLEFVVHKLRLEQEEHEGNNRENQDKM